MIKIEAVEPKSELEGSQSTARVSPNVVWQRSEKCCHIARASPTLASLLSEQLANS